MISKARPRKKPRSQSSILVGPETEWTDWLGIQLLFGLRRSTLYHVVNTLPELKNASVSLKGPGEERGKRLFHVPSVRAYLNSRISAEGQS
jgi:hypothetical protein